MMLNEQLLRDGTDRAGPGGAVGLDAVAGRVITELLERSHLLDPTAIGDQLAEAARPLGVRGVGIYLADVQEQFLRPMPGQAGTPAELPIDSTIAGRAYRTITMQHLPAADGGDGHRVWIPLVNGTERLGVMQLSVSDVSQPMLGCYRTLASLAGLMFTAKRSYSDEYVQAERRKEMSLQAEMVWAFLPPRTFATERVLVTASLEPAYEVGGDAFDYALIGERLHVSIFDSAGHDLASGLLASVGMASCRSTRRSGGSLADIVVRADHAIASQFGRSRFVTALLCDLDIRTGEFSWIPCGHPPPLLIRGNKVIKELVSPPQLPLGIGHLGQPCRAADVPRRTLRRISGAGADGAAGAGRPADARTPTASPRAAPPTAPRSGRGGWATSSSGTAARARPRRRRSAGSHRAIVEYQHGRLSDDATIVLLEWLPDHPANKLTP